MIAVIVAVVALLVVAVVGVLVARKRRLDSKSAAVGNPMYAAPAPDSFENPAYVVPNEGFTARPLSWVSGSVHGSTKPPNTPTASGLAGEPELEIPADSC